MRELRFAPLFLLAAALTPLTTFAQSTASGRFGNALSIGDTYAAAERNTVYFVVPMTVECWVNIGGRSGVAKAKSLPTILIANEPRHSVTHWELFTQPNTGHLAARFPGYEPQLLETRRDIVDGKWHHVAFTFDGATLRLHVDGAEAANAAIKKTKPYPDSGPLVFGYFPGVDSNRDVRIDEVRLSRVARPTTKVPDAPFTPDPDTTGLWHFDEADQAAKTNSYPDASATRNPARLYPITRDVIGAGGGFDGSRLVGGKTRWSDMDFGPFFSSTLILPTRRENVTHKAISIRLGDKHAIAFDTELLRFTAAWTGNFLNITPVREGLAGPPDVAGEVMFTARPGPGWSVTGDFTDPRPDKLGPLPREWGRYNGLYVHGNHVVLSYTVGDCSILEVPTVDEDGVIRRVIEMGPSKKSLTLRAADRDPEGKLGLRVIDLPPGAKVETDRFLGVVLRPLDNPVLFRMDIRPGPTKSTTTHPIGPVRPSQLMQGGPPRYPQSLVTKGALGTGDGPYVVDTLTAPDDNPYKSFLRFGGHDFFSNGDCAVCSVSGDVWVVSGIDEELEQLKWRRFATGLFQPLGLKIVDDKVHVLGRDQITRLHDLNSDGEADFYENFNNDCKVTTNGHAYATNLDTDPQGNFYYTKCADGTEHGGTLLRVSKEGSKLDVFATGLRNPNGSGVSPTGEVTAADNQGEWVPASRLDVVSQGEFLGYQPMSKRNPPPTDPGKPLCWMPQNVDNSSGGQTWVTSDRWGPFKDSMLHTSYGAAALLLVLREDVDGTAQGGVVRFPLTFDSGIMRARFRKQDGQLYVSGLRGWQTAGARDAALHRVRYTDKPVRMPSALSVHENGIKLTFTCNLDPELANDAESYSILRWNYRWSGEYGSRQWSLSDPSKQGYDTLKVKSAKLLEDGKSVILEIEDMRPVMQMQIGYDLESDDGAEVRGEIHNTVHVLNK